LTAFKMGGVMEHDMEAYFDALTHDQMKSRLHG
jgi:hypothetical protein